MWLTPGLLNHTAGAQYGLVILPGSLPPCFGVMTLISGFLTDAVKAHDSPWLAQRRLAVLARVLLSAAGLASSRPHSHLLQVPLKLGTRVWGPG